MLDHAIALQAPRTLALTEHRRLRFATLFLLYFAQGLPFGLIDFALPAWLAQNGASAAAIGGILAMIILPWTFKLAYGFVMDRYAFLAMGRRRPWILAGQVGLFAVLVAMAIVNPTVGQVELLTVFAFLLGLTSAVQDVAVDGLAVDVLPAEEIERVNGFMFGGQAIGMAMGAAISGTLIAYQGLPAACLALAMMVGAILILVVSVRERPGERLLPWTSGAASQRNLELHLGAFAPIVRNLLRAMFTRQTLLLIPAFIAASAAWGIFLGLAPLVHGQQPWLGQGYLQRVERPGQSRGRSGRGIIVRIHGGAMGCQAHVHRHGAHVRKLLAGHAGPAGRSERGPVVHRRDLRLHLAQCAALRDRRRLVHAALFPGDRRHPVRGVHGNSELGSGARGRVARVAGRAGRNPGDVHGHGRTRPDLRHLCRRRKSGPLRWPPHP